MINLHLTVRDNRIAYGIKLLYLVDVLCNNHSFDTVTCDIGHSFLKSLQFA